MTATWFQAASEGDIATVRALIVQGMDLDVRDEQERTALNIASQHKCTDIMTTILAAKQMLYIRQLGLDPYQVAESPEYDARAVARAGEF